MANKETARLSPTQRYNLMLAKALWFSTAMCSVGWSRFQNNFYLQNGLSSGEIGRLKSIGLILKMFGEPFWSMVADLTDQKTVFGLCMLMQILTMEILRIVKPLTYNTIFLVKVLRTTTAPSSTLTTTASYQLTEGTKEGYGQQRTFGSLAWGFGAFLVGYLIDHYGMDALFYYTYIFNVTSFFFVMYGLPSTRHRYAQSPPSPSTHGGGGSGGGQQALYGSRHGSRDEQDHLLRERHSDGSSTRRGEMTGASPAVMEADNKPPTNEPWSITTYFSEIRLFFAHPPSRFLLLNAFMYGVVMTVPDTFFFISLERDFKVSRTYSGICASAQIVASIPLFWFSDLLISRHGHFRLMFIAESVCLIRLLSYVILQPGVPGALYFLPIVQVLHGVTFALFWSSAVDAIHKLAPKDLTTSCIAALNVTYFTMAGAVGNVLWGTVYDHNTGGVVTVYWYATFLLVITILVLRQSASIITMGIADGVAGEGFAAQTSVNSQRAGVRNQTSSRSSSDRLKDGSIDL